MSDYEKMNDDKLLSLLFTEEDRLPRAVVDAIIRRGERMIMPLNIKDAA